MDATLMARVAQALWAADWSRGMIVTHWNELGDPGKEAYVKDARAFVAAAPAFGVEIREVEQ